jgi:hypothetical protein
MKNYLRGGKLEGDAYEQLYDYQQLLKADSDHIIQMNTKIFFPKSKQRLVNLIRGILILIVIFMLTNYHAKRALGSNAYTGIAAM